MKCPYTVNTVQYNKDKYSYDDNDRNTTHQHWLVERRTYIECLQSGCAVWVDGRCRYNQGCNG